MRLLVVGGAGAGKSTVLWKLESEWGFSVYRMDELAKDLYHPGNEAFDRILNLLGPEILLPDGGGFSFPRIAALIYKDVSLRKQVEEIVHPLVRKKVSEIFALAKKQGNDIAVETALPDESFVELCDEVWYIYADQETRIKRMMLSRGYSRERAVNTIRAQGDDESYRNLADFVLDNSGSEEETANEICKHCERLQREYKLHRI